MPSEPIKLPLVDNVLYIDNSSMELFNTCPRQAYYYIIRKLELNKPRIATEFGQGFHTVLENLYRTYGSEYRSADQNSAILRAVNLIPIATPEGDYRTQAYLAGAVDKYLTDYPAEPFAICRLPNSSPAIEVPFAFPFGVIESKIYGRIFIVWTGRIDLIYELNSRLGIMDHKTTSMMGPQYFAEFDISHQFYGYATAGEFIFNRRIDEVTINGLGCRKPSRTGKQYENQRHIIQIYDGLKDEWKRDCLAAVTSFVRFAEDGYYPKYTKWCINKYGPCQYRAICTLPPEHREAALATSEFRQVTWNPLQQTPAQQSES